MQGEDNRRCPPDGWNAVGLMSGTSVDGLDIAYVSFFQSLEDEGWSYAFKAFSTIKYPKALREKLWNAMSLGSEELARLDSEWGRWAEQEVVSWISQQGLTMPHVVGSHGHTVFHRPSEGWTHQIGSGAQLHAAIGVPVVCDLRSLDVALGGQGAPLVPLADEVLFGEWDVALNLGGFANLSLHDSRRGRMAWDVGPANLLLNMLAQTRGLDMDKDGEMAKSGVVLSELLEVWKSSEHHDNKPPKSLGREWLESEVWPHAERALVDNTLEDVMSTAVAYIAWAVSRDIPDSSSVLVTGGGVRNPALMDEFRRQSHGRDITWHMPPDMLMDGKEALVFAWLGLLRWLNLPNVLSSVTGCRVESSGGALWGSGPS